MIDVSKGKQLKSIDPKIAEIYQRHYFEVIYDGHRDENSGIVKVYIEIDHYFYKNEFPFRGQVNSDKTYFDGESLVLESSGYSIDGCLNELLIKITMQLNSKPSAKLTNPNKTQVSMANT